MIERSLATRQIGPYAIRAAISAVHADAATSAETDWPRIVALYDTLLRANPSSIVELNRTVAVAMRDRPEVGLAIIDTFLDRGDLADYHLLHSARGELLRRAGHPSEAAAAFRRALGLARQKPEQRLLEQRLKELQASQ